MQTNTIEQLEKEVWNDYKNSYGDRIKKLEDNEPLRRMIRGAIRKGCGMSKITRQVIRRTNGMIIESINQILGFKKYEDKIKWSNANKGELLRLEKAILKLTTQSHGSTNLNKENKECQ